MQSESSAVGSALRSGRRGRAFESPLSDINFSGDVAKLIFAASPFFSSKGEMQGIEMEAEGSVLKYVAKALPENLHTFSNNTIRMCDGLKCST